MHEQHRATLVELRVDRLVTLVAEVDAPPSISMINPSLSRWSST
jgi:hypothetical protein